MTENPHHYCMLPMPGESEGQTKAFLLDAYKWQAGTQVRVRFMEGDPGLQKRVAEVAKEWTGPPQMANVGFEFVDSGDADVRVAFAQGNGSWSYLGTMCQQIPSGKPTMNYGWLTPNSDKAELRRVVLHEFGHALGLIHEHQNPNKPIDWNRAAVIADLSRPPNSWDEATIENNMFKRYEPAEGSGTAVDPHSIMMYPIPAAWTTDGFSVGMNGELSETDKEFIRGAYPG
jgi:serralysin